MTKKPFNLLFVAMVLSLVFHGTIYFFTVDSTYDAYVHMFFADHYAKNWFEPWDNRWYTGFNVTSYPPLVHMLVALFSKVIGLRSGFILNAVLVMQLLVVGVYRFSLLWTNKRAAGYAALLACFGSSILEALHLFGQVPTLMGISCLLNALPEIYRWIKYGKWYRLLTGITIMGVGVTSHHVTTIFGMVFFVAPVMGLAVLDSLIEKQKNKKLPNENPNLGKSELSSSVRFGLIDIVIEAKNKWKEIVIFGACVPFVMLLIFPYFYWSSTDPITQVSIPHGSRDSFIEVPSSGLMFFLIPLGIQLLLLPYIFSRVWTSRNFFIGLSFSLLLLFGTGGTTPLPKIMLGANAFNILTLDRFTFWASIIGLPFIGEFFYRVIEGDFRVYLRDRFGTTFYRLFAGFIGGVVAILTIFIVSLGNFRPLQPKSIDMKPIVQFLERDQHENWRYMTLGFGDQMAWLSAQTKAQSVDGNYHSARRLPEMTTRPLERLENSKFKGLEGIGSLQQFLTVPEKYFLKFVFSNDKFYDPILYFAGWERVQRLENGIMVWQKQDVPPLPTVLPKKDLPKIIKVWWGVMPVGILIVAFGVNFILLWYSRILNKDFYKDEYISSDDIIIPDLKRRTRLFLIFWIITIMSIVTVVSFKTATYSPHQSPQSVVEAYYDAIDFKYFKTAHGFFDPTDSPTFDDYFVKLSVEDGILASYAKLNNLKVKLKKINSEKYEAYINAEWITPVEEYYTKASHLVVKHKGKWYIKAPSFDSNIPADTFIEEKKIGLHGHGKRQAGTKPTQHDDVLDRPELQILNGRLVMQDSSYFVIGELQNIDVYPAHITISSDLYDKNGRKLVSYNAKYATIHRILPMEKIPFKIEFESTAWKYVRETKKNADKFNPNEFSPFKFSSPPVDFKIFARSVVDKNDLYRSYGIQDLKVKGELLSGSLLNYGTEEISVPKLLITYTDQNNDLAWLDTYFMRDGIRQQRKREFNAPLRYSNKLKIIKVGTNADFFVNGLANALVLKKKSKDVSVKVKANGFEVSILPDGYIANPTLY
ncbi:hypothetical protein [Lacihabitans soyangensis]|uniref:Uncharacterized protein n=1 Tax=Lacihabitans soyangensis TaxID=869394 RepID=A0AAE3KTJ9_9BACT|nr:hypothetical protein [Lacihabitans soyangensis]MCP9763839.1 hypothetical protein [Lacihabitans soyangensis]